MKLLIKYIENHERKVKTPKAYLGDIAFDDKPSGKSLDTLSQFLEY